MSDPFLAEIRLFPLTFAPKGWAFCDGQLLAISQNTALFSLLGTTYGGNGTSTFQLPNMQGNVAMDAGQGPGLTFRELGEMGGSTFVTLLTTEMAAHTHVMLASAELDANKSAPTSTSSFSRIKSGSITPYQTANNVQMSGNVVGLTGNNQPHNNMMPYLTLNFCIALTGVFPPRG